MIVVGSHGKGMMAQLFVNSVSQGVLSRANCPGPWWFQQCLILQVLNKRLPLKNIAQVAIYQLISSCSR